MLPFIERPFCWVLLIGYFLCTGEWSCHDIQCFVGFFQKRLLTIPAESLAVMMNACYKKHVDRRTCCFLFGESQQKAVCYLGWCFAYLYIKPKCVCTNDCVLCQYMVWHFKKNWKRQVPVFLTCFFTKFTWISTSKYRILSLCFTGNLLAWTGPLPSSGNRWCDLFKVCWDNLVLLWVIERCYLHLLIWLF